MKGITKKLLEMVADLFTDPKGAYNIREDSGCAARQSTQNIHIKPKEDAAHPGIEILVKPGTKGETAYIPACVTHSDVHDLVYNDFYIGEGADVTIVAGCGVHTDGEGESQHDGIHRFFVGKNARVLYLEKHVGIGEGSGKRIINPQTYIELDTDSYMEMDTSQIGGVDSTDRVSKAVLQAGSRLVIKEKILTQGDQSAKTSFDVELNGENCGADLISRSVAKQRSKQMFHSKIIGNNRCSGHSECDAIIMDHGTVSALPELTANHVDAALIHEAAIGKIAGEQIIKLRTLGLTEAQAEAKIIEGFLR